MDRRIIQLTAKQYLKQLQRLAANIVICQEELARLRMRLESTTVSIQSDKVQTSGAGDKFADAIAALADKELYYQELLEDYEHMRQVIVFQILNLDDRRHSSILYSRYVEGKSLSAIAHELAYSYDRCKHLHGEALLAFEEKFIRSTS